MQINEIIQTLSNIHTDCLLARDAFEGQGRRAQVTNMDVTAEEVLKLMDIFREKIDPSFPCESAFDDFTLSISPGHYEYNKDIGEATLCAVLKEFNYYSNHYLDNEVIFYEPKVTELQDIFTTRDRLVQKKG